MQKLKILYVCIFSTDWNVFEASRTDLNELSETVTSCASFVSTCFVFNEIPNLQHRGEDSPFYSGKWSFLVCNLIVLSGAQPGNGVSGHPLHPCYSVSSIFIHHCVFRLIHKTGHLQTATNNKGWSEVTFCPSGPFPSPGSRKPVAMETVSSPRLSLWWTPYSQSAWIKTIHIYTNIDQNIFRILNIQYIYNLN